MHFTTLILTYFFPKMPMWHSENQGTKISKSQISIPHLVENYGARYFIPINLNNVVLHKDIAFGS